MKCSSIWKISSPNLSTRNLQILISKTRDKTEENYNKEMAKMLDPAASAVTSSDTKPKVKSKDLNIPSNFRSQEITEDTEKTVYEKLVPINKTIKNNL